MELIRDSYTRSRVLIQEVAKFGIVGALAFGITVGGADALRSEAHLGDVFSVTVSVVVATIFTFLGSKYWTFKTARAATCAANPCSSFSLTASDCSSSSRSSLPRGTASA